jgi:hypothetical protein
MRGWLCGTLTASSREWPVGPARRSRCARPARGRSRVGRVLVSVRQEPAGETTFARSSAKDRLARRRGPPEGRHGHRPTHGPQEDPLVSRSRNRGPRPAALPAVAGAFDLCERHTRRSSKRLGGKVLFRSDPPSEPMNQRSSISILAWQARFIVVAAADHRRIASDPELPGGRASTADRANELKLGLPALRK